MFASRRSLLLVYRFTRDARASSGTRPANPGGCELNFLAAEPAWIAVELGSELSKLLGKLHLKACLAIV